MTKLRLLLLASALLVLGFSASIYAQQDAVEGVMEGECAAGEDGECVQQEMAKVEDPYPGCVNQEKECDFWASAGECDKNAKYMLKGCPRSCGVCGIDDIDALIKAATVKRELEEKREQEMTKNFGLEQEVPDGLTEKEVATQMWFEHTKMYMEQHVHVEERFAKVRDACQNKHEKCTKWAAFGECLANPSYMNKECAPACRMCHYLIFDERCPFDGNQESNVFKEGDLNRMFERIVSDESYQEKYGITVYSKPGGDADNESVLDGPWVITLEDFLSEEECERLITLGADRGYEQSMDVGEERPDGTFTDYEHPGRTSKNAWCLEACYEDELTQQVLTRIENLTGIPDKHSEYLQLLKYNEGEFYTEHHDYIPMHTGRAEGNRILTVFLYLNDVEAGGGTNFPKLDITVMPKRGKVLVWPSVLDEDPNSSDQRTYHQALPVDRGVKYAANAWIHQRDFKEVFARKCV